MCFFHFWSLDSTWCLWASQLPAYLTCLDMLPPVCSGPLLPPGIPLCCLDTFRPILPRWAGFKNEWGESICPIIGPVCSFLPHTNKQPATAPCQDEAGLFLGRAALTRCPVHYILLKKTVLDVGTCSFMNKCPGGKVKVKERLTKILQKYWRVCWQSLDRYSTLCDNRLWIISCDFVTIYIVNF